MADEDNAGEMSPPGRLPSGRDADGPMTAHPDPVALPDGHGPVVPSGHDRLRRLAHQVGADDALPLDPDLGPEDARQPPRRTGTEPPHRYLHPGVLVAIFAGGFAGTLSRYAVERAWPAGAGHFPTATFVINTSGAFILGLLLTVLIERLPSRARALRPFAATGVLGGWTTYSSLVVESLTLAKGGHVAVAAGYLALSLLCGLIAIAFGIALGRSRRADALLPALASQPADRAGTGRSPVAPQDDRPGRSAFAGDRR